MSEIPLFTSHSEFARLSYHETMEEATQCKRCSLSQTRRNVVFAQGTPPCPVMCIGEAPGADEDAQGIPFVGRAGQLLTKMLESINLNRPSDVYIANILKCRPPGNRAPLPLEIKSCLSFLFRQIAEVKPAVIILLGSPAMKSILNTSESISKMRGKWVKLKTDFQENSIDVITLFHPSYLLRNASHDIGTPKWLTWQDLKSIREKLVTL